MNCACLALQIEFSNENDIQPAPGNVVLKLFFERPTKENDMVKFLKTFQPVGIKSKLKQKMIVNQCRCDSERTHSEVPFVDIQLELPLNIAEIHVKSRFIRNLGRVVCLTGGNDLGKENIDGIWKPTWNRMLLDKTGNETFKINYHFGMTKFLRLQYSVQCQGSYYIGVSGINFEAFNSSRIISFDPIKNVKSIDISVTSTKNLMDPTDIPLDIWHNILDCFSDRILVERNIINDILRKLMILDIGFIITSLSKMAGIFFTS